MSTTSKSKKRVVQRDARKRTRSETMERSVTGRTQGGGGGKGGGGERRGTKEIIKKNIGKKKSSKKLEFVSQPGPKEHKKKVGVR